MKNDKLRRLEEAVAARAWHAGKHPRYLLMDEARQTYKAAFSDRCEDLSTAQAQTMRQAGLVPMVIHVTRGERSNDAN